MFRFLPLLFSTFSPSNPRKFLSTIFFSSPSFLSFLFLLSFVRLSLFPADSRFHSPPFNLSSFPPSCFSWNFHLTDMSLIKVFAERVSLTSRPLILFFADDVCTYRGINGGAGDGSGSGAWRGEATGTEVSWATTNATHLKVWRVTQLILFTHVTRTLKTPSVTHTLLA